MNKPSHILAAEVEASQWQLTSPSSSHLCRVKATCPVLNCAKTSDSRGLGHEIIGLKRYASAKHVISSVVCALVHPGHSESGMQLEPPASVTTLGPWQGLEMSEQSKWCEDRCASLGRFTLCSKVVYRIDIVPHSFTLSRAYCLQKMYIYILYSKKTASNKLLYIDRK